MKLPAPGPKYDARNEAAVRTAVEMADADNLKGSTDNYLSGRQFRTAASGLTAHAGGGKASALVLTRAINHIGTVGTAGDSVLLIPAKAGLTITVINASTSKAIQVFGQGSDTIDGVATGTGVPQSYATAVDYVCPVDGAWFSL